MRTILLVYLDNIIFYADIDIRIADQLTSTVMLYAQGTWDLVVGKERRKYVLYRRMVYRKDVS